MLTSTVENYLKEIFLFSQAKSLQTMPMGEVAMALNVTPGTATSMIKSLEDSEFVTYQPRVGVTLTQKGHLQALRVVRRHRLIEYFLVETLGMDWSEVHSEAEILEHSISDRVLDKIDEHLDFPTRDPHGDPIPRKDGSILDDSYKPLDESKVGKSYRIVRITDQSGKFLNFAAKHGLMPSTELHLLELDRDGGILSLQLTNSKCVPLGISAANKILVSEIG
jgi:DtxR family Mn-dependent transcriptional regulator